MRFNQNAFIQVSRLAWAHVHMEEIVISQQVNKKLDNHNHTSIYFWTSSLDGVWLISYFARLSLYGQF